MSLREFKAKEVIFKEGEHGESLFVISEGTVEIYVRYGEPDQQKIKTLSKNQIFGEMAVIEYYPRSATAVAASDVKLIEVKCGEISDFFKSNPDKIIQIMQQLSLRIRELTDDYNVVGVDESWTSNNIYDFLRAQQFAGDHLPEIEVKTLFYKYMRVVVIKCRSSKYVPFYLTKRYQGINENQIYTRLGDTNTPKNKSANYSDVERLWRFHFERESE